jgi:hypothetical protein
MGTPRFVWRHEFGHSAARRFRHHTTYADARRQTNGPVEKVQFLLADSSAKRVEFDDSVLSDWCFSTGPYGFLRIDARVKTGGLLAFRENG